MDEKGVMEMIETLNKKMRSIFVYPDGEILISTGNWEEKSSNGFYKSITNPGQYCVWVSELNASHVEVFHNNKHIDNLAVVAEEDLNHIYDRLKEVKIWMMEAEV